jgi:hypothetical protein
MREEPIVIDRVERVERVERIRLEKNSGAICTETASESSEASRRVGSTWSFGHPDLVVPDLAPQLMGWV